MTNKKLIEYCKKNKIFLPLKITREYLVAAIFRHHNHEKDYKSFGDCFGFWEKDRSACLYCEHGDFCFGVSIGMPKEEYERVRLKR